MPMPFYILLRLHPATDNRRDDSPQRWRRQSTVATTSDAPASGFPGIGGIDGGGCKDDASPTPRVRGEQEQHRSLTDAIIEASFGAMFLTDEDGTIHFVNDAASQTAGFAREEIICRNISLILGWGKASRHDFYMRRYLRTGKSAFFGKTREGQNLLARQKDGTDVPSELGLAEIRSSGSGRRSSSSDSSGTSTNGRGMRPNALADAIIEASVDAMLIVDGAGVIKMVNAAATDQFGFQ